MGTLSDGLGGYFELEINDLGSVYHDLAIAVNSCRNALEYILLANSYNKIYLPYYTCDVILQPINKIGIEYEFYHLDDSFFPIIDIVEDNSVLLFVNYFGIMKSKALVLQNKFKNLIMDNAHAFFSPPIKGLSTIYSPRKFFGVPDGGFVYSSRKLNFDLDFDKSIDRTSHLLTRIDCDAETGFELFKNNEKLLNNLPLMKMSKLTNKLLRGLDFDFIREKRNKNFNFLHKQLRDRNRLTPIIEEDIIDGPLVYPFWTNNISLKKRLIENKVYCATYWPNVKSLCKKGSLEVNLTNELINLPIDQRCNDKDLFEILKFIL